MKIFIWGSVKNSNRRGQDQYWSYWDGAASDLTVIGNEQVPENCRQFNAIDDGPLGAACCKHFQKSGSTETVLTYALTASDHKVRLCAVLSAEEFETLYDDDRVISFFEFPSWLKTPAHLNSKHLATEIFPDFFNWWNDAELPEYDKLTPDERKLLAAIVDKLSDRISDGKDGLPVGVLDTSEGGEDARFIKMRKLVYLAMTCLPYKIARPLSFNTSAYYTAGWDIFCSARVKDKLDCSTDCLLDLNSNAATGALTHDYAKYILQSEGDPCIGFEELESVDELDTRARDIMRLNKITEIRDGLVAGLKPNKNGVIQTVKSCESVSGRQKSKIEKIITEVAYCIFFSYNLFSEFSTVEELRDVILNGPNLTAVESKTAYNHIKSFSAAGWDSEISKHPDKAVAFITFLRECELKGKGGTALKDDIKSFLHDFPDERFEENDAKSILGAFATYISTLSEEGLVRYIVSGFTVLSRQAVVKELKRRYPTAVTKHAFCRALKKALGAKEEDGYYKFVTDFFKDEEFTRREDFDIIPDVYAEYREKLAGFWKGKAEGAVSRLKQTGGLTSADLITLIDCGCISKAKCQSLYDELRAKEEREKIDGIRRTMDVRQKNSKLTYEAYSRSANRKIESTGAKKNGNRWQIILIDLVILAASLVWFIFLAPAFVQWLSTSFFVVGMLEYGRVINTIFSVAACALIVAFAAWHLWLMYKYDRITVRICITFLCAALILLLLYFSCIFAFILVKAV